MRPVGDGEIFGICFDGASGPLDDELDQYILPDLLLLGALHVVAVTANNKI